MNKVLNWISILAAVIYWIFPMWVVFALLLFMPLAFLSNVNTITSSGFAGLNISHSLIGVIGLLTGISMLIPPFRRAYRKFPWLHSFIKILFVDFVILNIGEVVLNFGYQVQNNSRHAIFFTLMIVQIILCRVGMCIYFKLKPVKPIEA